MTRLTRPSCAALTFVTAILICAAATSPSQTPDAKSKPTGSVSGRVTIGDKPAPGVVITAAGSNQPTSMGQATTDSDGHYRIGGLPVGPTVVTPAAPLYVLPSSSPISGPGKTVDLSSGEAVDGIDFKLSRGAVMTGRVTDGDGRPVIEERITLTSVDDNGALSRSAQFSRITNFQMYQTDDRGIFRLYGLPAGRYKVSVGDEPGMVSGSRMAGYYQKTYHPNATDIAQAAIVDLSEGSEAKNIDISLGRRAATYTVSGRIVDADTGKPLPGVSFAFGVLQKNPSQSYIAGSSAPGTTTNSLGEFRLEGIEPGHYAVFIQNRFDFTGNANTGPTVFSDPLPFDVVDGDVTDLEVKAQQGLSISGVVVADGIADKKALARISTLKIGATSSPTQSGIRVMPEAHSAAIGPDGSFEVGGLRPGRVSLYLMGPNGSDTRGFSIARTERDGDPQNRGLDLQPGQSISALRIFLSYGTGVVRGQVKVEGGTLPGDVMLFVSMSREGTSIRAGGQADSRGQFVIESLSTGTYEVVLQVVSFGGKLPPGIPPQQRQTVTVTDGADTQVLFTLKLTPKDGQ